MTLMIFGVECVGKSTVGEIIADMKGWKFYDLDDEIKKHYKMPHEKFVEQGTLK